MGWDTFSLLGHSLGAALVTTMAGLFASRVKHLIVVEGFGAWINPNKTNFVDEFNKAMFTNKVPLSSQATATANGHDAIPSLPSSDGPFQGESGVCRC